LGLSLLLSLPGFVAYILHILSGIFIFLFIIIHYQAVHFFQMHFKILTVQFLNLKMGCTQQYKNFLLYFLLEYFGNLLLMNHFFSFAIPITSQWNFLCSIPK